MNGLLKINNFQSLNGNANANSVSTSVVEPSLNYNGDDEGFDLGLPPLQQSSRQRLGSYGSGKRRQGSRQHGRGNYQENQGYDDEFALDGEGKTNEKTLDDFARYLTRGVDLYLGDTQQ